MKDSFWSARLSQMYGTPPVDTAWRGTGLFLSRLQRLCLALPFRRLHRNCMISCLRDILLIPQRGRIGWIAIYSSFMRNAKPVLLSGTGSPASHLGMMLLLLLIYRWLCLWLVLAGLCSCVLGLQRLGTG